MIFSLNNFIVMLCTTGVPVSGSPSGLDIRQDAGALPDADYCCCVGNNYNCKVPHAEGGAPDPVCTLQLCPHNPETEKQCCCCDPHDDPWTVKCRKVPKDASCPCTKIYCPFNWGEQHLPGYPWTSPA